MKGWTTEQAVKKLKGPKGTTVNISIKRGGYDGLINMDVVRDEVNITTVRAAFMIDKETGYVKLDQFTETSDRELGDALQKLSANGMKRLVFDLRENPGGALDQAIRVANRFLPRGDMIVSNTGARAERQSELSRDGTGGLHASADRHARQSQQRERVRNRQRRAAGSRSRAHRRGNDVRQGARAVGLSDQRRSRRGRHDRALLHSLGPADSASVGRDL
jgi:hypothetical protein